ncbi:MAG: hypothetical protein AAB338_01650 [Patescibacteria group bacterium]
MNQKAFVNIILIVVIVALVGAGIYFVSTRQVATPTPSAATIPTPTPTASLPFPLNDRLSRYYLEKLGNRFVLTYEKTSERPLSIYVSSDTKIPLENYLGKNLIVSGEFVVEIIVVQCIKAPCEPISSTVVRLKSIATK